MSRLRRFVGEEKLALEKWQEECRLTSKIEPALSAATASKRAAGA
jgi:hypothetical protein